MNHLLFEDFQPLSAIATTSSGAKKLQPFCQASGATLWLPESLISVDGAQFYSEPLKSHIANLWHSQRALVFCLATRAVVRLIAPLLQHKSSDPAVVVIDEAGKFVISLCSGHQGGADKLSFAIAKVIGATPVLTSASSAAGLTAVDLLGVPFGWYKGEGDWTGVSSAIARGERVQVIQDAGSTLWRKAASFGRSNFSFEESPQTKAKIWITPYNSQQAGLSETTAQLQSSANPPLPQVQWHPRVLWVGIGCERGTSRQLIETAIAEVCRKHQLAEGAIAGIATIDIKADEVGILELCRDLQLPLQTFPSELLRTISVPNPSTIVDAEVGTPSVAEAAALSAAKSQTLLVPKQIFRFPIENFDSQLEIQNHATSSTWGATPVRGFPALKGVA